MAELFVANKPQMYRLLYAGRFGNRAAAWPTLQALSDSGFTGRVVVRERRTGGFCQYGIPQDEVPAVLQANSLQPEMCNFNEAMPDDKLTIQGEVTRTYSGLALFFSRAPKPMRVALRESGEQVYGLAATSVLRDGLDAASYEDLMTLLDDAPDAVVEFSAYRENVGVIPHRKMVVWEVRNY